MIEAAARMALSPLASRVPRIVREHEILRIAANLIGKDARQLGEAARREVLTWAQIRSGGMLPPEAWASRDFEFLSGGRNSVGIRIEGDQADIWAMRSDVPDRTVAGRVWTTEVAVILTAGGPVRFSTRLLVSTSEETLDIEPHTPGLVQQIADKYGLWRGSYELDAAPWHVDSPGEADRLADMLVAGERQLPVFVLTIPDTTTAAGRPLLDAYDLARAILGLGHVVVLPAAYTWTLTHRFGKTRSVFNGAIRAYLPGFAEDANLYDHKLVMADNLASADGVATCTSWIRSLAARESIRHTRLSHDLLAFAAIRRASLQEPRHRFEEHGPGENEHLRAATARIGALEKQLDDASSMADFFDAEHKAAVERAEVAESQLAASQYRVQQLLEQIRMNGGVVDSTIPLPTCWADFANWSDETLAGRVVLCAAARRAVKTPEFENVRLAARCLLWLANEGREWRRGGGGGSFAEASVENGIRNAHCGDDAFTVEWRGRRHIADWHIKSGGNTREPRRCLRIYYFWDDPSQQIVIAHMPAHRRTGAT